MQQPPLENDPARNVFARQTNKSMFQRLIALGYPKCDLTEQHRTITVISNVISKIWYQGTVVSTVDQDQRPNAAKAIQAHKMLFARETPIMWVLTEGESTKMGFSQSSQNERELQVAIKLCQQYVKQGIEAKDIVILAGYIAQANFTKRALALIPELHDVDSGTIDGYQGEEKSIAILCMVGSQKSSFMALSARLLTGVSRAADGLAVITNSVGIDLGENKRTRQQYDLLKHMIGRDGYASYSEELPALNLIMHDHDIHSDDQDTANADDQDTANADTNGTLPGSNEADTNGGWRAID